MLNNIWFFNGSVHRDFYLRILTVIIFSDDRAVAQYRPGFPVCKRKLLILFRNCNNKFIIHFCRQKEAAETTYETGNFTVIQIRFDTRLFQRPYGESDKFAALQMMSLCYEICTENRTAKLSPGSGSTGAGSRITPGIEMDCMSYIFTQYNPEATGGHFKISGYFPYKG